VSNELVNINEDGTLKCPHCAGEYLRLWSPDRVF
jgi:hypothetical protein